MKHLILDVGGVLVYPKLGVWHLPWRIAEMLGPERAASLHTEAFWQAHAACMPWLREDRIVMETETECMHRRGFILELDRRMGWHMTDDEIAAMAWDFTHNAGRYDVFSDVRTMLERWSSRYTLSVLSDAMPSIADYLEAYGIRKYFREIVISTHVGATKPDPQMFAAVLGRLGADPADCLFVDDRDINVRGAVAAGLQAVQMNRPEFPADGLWEGPVVHSFVELDARLGEGLFR